MDKNWLLGFVEGEGCFSIRLSKKNDYRTGVYFSPAFGLGLTIEDKKVIYEIKKFLGFGTIDVINNKKQRALGKNYRDVIRILVVGIKNCIKIRDLLKDLEWHTKKRKDFECWSKAIDIMKNKGNLTLKGIKEICDLREKMNQQLQPKRRWYNYHSKQKILSIVKKRKRKYCKYCQREIPPNLSSRKFCNKNCKRIYYNEYHRKRYHKLRKHNPDDFKICIICGEKFYRKDTPKKFERRKICLKKICRLKRDAQKTMKYYLKKRNLF